MTNEELVALIQAGERDRIMELWAQVERLVVMKACKWDFAFQGRNGATLDDYIQAGFLGFLKAIDYYKPDRGAAFNTVLCMCILTPFQQTASVRNDKQSREPNHWTSLDATISEDDGDTLGDFIVDPHGEDALRGVELEDYRGRLHDTLEAVLNTLTEEQQRVLRCRYYDGRTLEQIGAELGQDATYAKKVCADALRSLRHPCRSKTLRKFWAG